jgi:glucose/arabinose dehydrogenase
MYALQDGTNYGWPYCYQSGPGRFPDPKFNARSSKLNCRDVPAAYAAFDAHSSPLGLEYFDASSTPELRDSFLVGLHGSTKENLNRGYRVVRLRGLEARTATPENFIDGFLEGRKIHGRPCDILSLGNDSFLLTDDYAGVVYYVYKK